MLYTEKASTFVGIFLGIFVREFRGHFREHFRERVRGSNFAVRVLCALLNKSALQNLGIKKLTCGNFGDDIISILSLPTSHLPQAPSRPLCAPCPNSLHTPGARWIAFAIRKLQKLGDSFLATTGTNASGRNTNKNRVLVTLLKTILTTPTPPY